MNVENNLGWIFGLAAIGVWAINNYRLKQRFVTVSEEKQLEIALKHQETRILALEREVETLKAMYYESQITIKRYENEIAYHKRRADEAESRLIAMGGRAAG